MDTVDLPFVSSRTTIADAIETLRRSGRAGVVVQREDVHALLFISELAAARRAGKRTVGEVGAERTLERVLIGNAPLGLYGIGALSVDMAQVVTAHERLAAALQASYVCNGPVQHYFPVPDVAPFDDCPECVTPPGGVRPTVQRFV